MTAKKLEDLIVGDRFYFPDDNKKQVYQLTVPGVKHSASKGDRPRYNIIIDGHSKLMFDKQSWGSKDVIFLRNAYQ